MTKKKKERKKEARELQLSPKLSTTYQRIADFISHWMAGSSGGPTYSPRIDFSSSISHRDPNPAPVVHRQL
jgi:hypothetical protein